MKKNIIIAILSFMVFSLVMYIICDKYIDNRDTTQLKNDVNIGNDKDNGNDNYLIEDDFKSLDEMAQDIFNSIKNVKNDKNISDTEKAQKIVNLVFSNYNKILNYSSNCECSIEDSDYYDCKLQNYGSVSLSKDFTCLTDVNIRRFVSIDDSINDNYITLIQFMNYLDYLAYTDYLKNEADICIEYNESLYNKFNLTTENACIGYSNERNNFYINVNMVDSPKLGWYYFDKFTGECSYTVKTVAQYKINKKTYDYELVEE